MLMFLGRLVVGTGKLVARRVLVPMAVAAIVAATLKAVADRLPDDDEPHALK
jgi:hypothetical protein